MRADHAMIDSNPYARAPFMVFWEVTRACDLACFHCRASAVPRRDPRELSTAEGRRLLEEIAAMGTKVVVLTGGDPAKRPDLVELVRHGAVQGLRMALTPSATPLVTISLLERLRDAGLARLALSVDSASAERHDAKRGVEGAFARSIHLLEGARLLGLSTQMNTSIARYEPPELDGVAALAEQVGVSLLSVFFIVPIARAASVRPMSPRECEAALEHLARIAEAAPFDVKTTAAPHFRRVLLQRKQRRSAVVGIADGIGRALRGVNDGQGVVFVSNRGAISPSGFLPIVCGNVRVEGLTKTYREHPLFLSLRDTTQLGGKCGRCEFRHVCGGSRARAYAASGDPLAFDPSCAYEPKSRAIA
jgi:radical SAM protein